MPDILDKEGKFLAFTVFQEKYKINTSFLCYIALCNAIPKHWRKVFRRDKENDLVVSDDSVEPFKNSPPTCRQARAFYVSKSFQNLHQKFVLLRLASQIRQLRRYTFFHSSSQKNIKLSMFQFKINHHILYTRDKAFKAFLKYKLYKERSSVRESLSL